MRRGISRVAARLGTGTTAITLIAGLANAHAGLAVASGSSLAGLPSAAGSPFAGLPSAAGSPLAGLPSAAGSSVAGLRLATGPSITAAPVAGGPSVAGSPAAAERPRVHRACHAPRPGAAACQGLRLVAASLPADERAAATSPANISPRARVGPTVTYTSPLPGYLTPEELRDAYALPSETTPAAGQTIALIDAYDDPTAEADLGVFDEQFGLPACTSANGCFRKVNEEGSASPLPPEQGEWASEISIDLQMAHAICQACHLLLVEASSEKFTDLGTAVNTAAGAGATEINNSYVGPEKASYATYGSRYYEHPGIALTAASGDCGYLNQACPSEPTVVNFPASSPNVIAVGGTALSETGQGWTSTVWDESGSGCSVVFSAPPWQLGVGDFSQTGCGSARSVADVAAVGDPETGVDIYDSTPEGGGEPLGWGVWGGTSVAAPIVAAELALAGGADGAADPAATLYAHEGQSEALDDVVTGSNGSCGDTTACQAAPGYDGPSGLGSPFGLGAFVVPEPPMSAAPPTVSGFAEVGQTLRLTEGDWTGRPWSISDQWEDCATNGTHCAPIAGATGATYTLVQSDLGSTIRVQETATNAGGPGSPALSAPTAPVSSNVPLIKDFTPAKGITGSVVVVEGAGLGSAGEVQFDGLAASFTAVRPTELEAIVPDGTRVGKLTVTAPAGSAKSATKFTPTLSLTGFSPARAKPGKTVTVKGLGFNHSSQVSFGGVAAASVVYESAKKLKAIVPAEARAGPLTVTNTAAPDGTVSSTKRFTP